MTLTWNPLYRVHLVPTEGVFLLSDDQTRLLDDARVVALAPLLAEDTHTADEVAAHLSSQIPLAETYYVLQWLQQKEYIVTTTATASWLNLASAVQPLTEALRQAGESSVRLVLIADELDPALAEINRQQLATGQAWLLCRPTGTRPWLGALFVPGETACWACLAERRRNLQPTRVYLAEQWPETRLPNGHSSLAPQRLAQLVTLLSRADVVAQLHGRVHLLNAEPAKKGYPIALRPQCPACGDPTHLPRQQIQSPELTSHTRYHTTDHGQRLIRTTDMLAQLAPHRNPVTGLIRTVQPTLSGALHAMTTQHNVALPHADWRSVQRLVRGRAGGKGRTAAQAELSAVAETIERYTAVWQGDEPVHLARWGDFDHMHHPHDLLLFSETQYTRRADWNRSAPPFNHVPEPFDTQQKIGWSLLFSLLTGQRHYVPTALLYYGYAQRAGTTFGRADSNGCAAGSNLTEAFLQGFLELVERDAVALWWYNRLSRPAVAWQAWPDEGLAQAIAQLAQEEGREVWFLDVTSDFGLPTFTAVSKFQPHDPRAEAGAGLLFGFGTHFDPRIALWRALTELGQMVPLLRHGIPAPHQFDPTAVAWWQTATCANQPYLRPDPNQAPRTPADYPTLTQPDLRDEAHWCLNRAQTLGLDVLLLNQTRPDVPLTVVKVLVPGMRHFWARLAPGRLYAVPVAQGWLTTPHSESDLNPWPIFL